MRNNKTVKYFVLFCIMALLAISSCEAAVESVPEVTPLPTPHEVEICTERDCGPTLFVHLAGAVPDIYTFILHSEGRIQREVLCREGVGDYGPNHFASMSYLECRSDGVQFINLSPEEMTVTVRWQDGEYSQALMPDYGVSYPNGLNCPPECRTGSVTLTIPPPATSP